MTDLDPIEDFAAAPGETLLDSLGAENGELKMGSFGAENGVVPLLL
ncbi:hypothetical protein ACWPKS_07710 [Coraliomargarita sp. W4R72]